MRGRFFQDIVKYTIQHLRSEGYNVDEVKELDPHKDRDWPHSTPYWIGARVYAFYCTKLLNPTIDTNIGKARLLL